MLGYEDLLNWPSIEMNAVWEPLIKKEKQMTANPKQKQSKTYQPAVLAA